jgi:hypothetical protein
MKIVVFVTLILFSYTLVSSALSYWNPENGPKNDVLAETKTIWPAHWKKEGRMKRGPEFHTWYSPHKPQNEHGKSLEHFRKLGYDAGESYNKKRNESCILISTKNAKITFTIHADEYGGLGSTITAMIIPKPRKEAQ